jgi:DNA invertase Pin-like site-specific DNA recombinase
MKQVRCAIYTRKSSDEGLEQSFNSLDAQREACAAYILSQASEGWVEVAGHYDDGGLSGGTLERPALQRLLADVAAGAIDIIVVYKVDRLTRSLLDFSRLVEAFDAAGASFVSVTQSFNTTTSMGRLTLNMLLSFAQFEREVTAERIRDKIAASKAKGMWMGGIPPLGYKPNGRSLTIVEEHAALVRHIFTRYLALGNVRALEQELKAQGRHAPARATATGRHIGGVPFSRGQLYLMLKCRTFLGEIDHKGVIYPGLHEGIMPRELWDAVQAMLSANLQGKRSGSYTRSPSLLAGLIVDGDGRPLASTHASKGKVRYRYYTSADAAEGSVPLRIPAREIEAAVAARVAHMFDDPLTLAAAGWLEVPSDRYAKVTTRIGALAARVRRRDRDLLRSIVTRVQVQRSGVSIDIATAAVAAALDVAPTAEAPATLTLTHDVRLTRTGMAMRLVHDSGATTGASPDRSMSRLLVQAHHYWRELRKGELDITSLAEREGVSASWVTRTLRLAFLSPEVTAAILTGKQRSGIDLGALTATDAVQPSWQVQRQRLMPRQS